MDLEVHFFISFVDQKPSWVRIWVVLGREGRFLSFEESEHKGSFCQLIMNLIQ